MAAPMEEDENVEIVGNIPNNFRFEVNKVAIMNVLSALNSLEDLETRFLQEFMSDSDETIDDMIVLCKSLRDDKIKIGLYAEVTIWNQLDIQWSTAFRMDRSTVEKLLQVLAPLVSPCTVSGRKSVPLEKRVLMFLFWLAHQDQFRLVGDRFNVSESTAHSSCMNLVKVINENLVLKYIKWPGEDRQREISNFYWRSFSFPGVIGSIDGTHVEIQRPGGVESSYYNRKQFHSILLQVTCDHHLLLTSINAGAPGRCNDARIFRRCNLNIAEGQTREIQKYFALPEYHILGDGAYPLRSYLLRPFKDFGTLSVGEKKFNRKLSSCRSDSERCIGRIKNRWKKLKYIPTPDPGTAREILVTCCVLHNFCILSSDSVEIHIEEDRPRRVHAQNGDHIEEHDDEDQNERGERKVAQVMRLMNITV